MIVKYLITDGLTNAGKNEMARWIINSSFELIRESGYAEYYDPIDGEPCGGGRFTWTAAMVLEFLLVL